LCYQRTSKGVGVDSYLSIAQTVLRLARRPLSAREIVEMAYRHDLVPSRLYGKTQQKTVGARLSEDILVQRERSLFYRSEPGKFFLREFLSDPTIPSSHRSPIIARRRQRELRRGAALTLSRNNAFKAASAVSEIDGKFHSIIESCHFHYSDPARRHRRADEVFVWSFVMFVRGMEVLTYRHGRYREGRDNFLKRKSVGFFTPVVDKDHDLFDEGDHGILASGVRAVMVDLDLPASAVPGGDYAAVAKITDLIVSPDPNGHEDLLAVVSFACPRNFEPVSRRLAINDLSWMRLDVPVNHIEDFDPWSQAVVSRAQAAVRRQPGGH
jgi:hypothetical protein